MNPADDEDDWVLTELLARTPQDLLEEAWFAERELRVSLPTPRRPCRPAVPPTGDAEVDAWLR